MVFEFSQIKALALQGQVTAQFMLAEFYRKGIGTDKDLAAAVEWYEKAATRGHPKAAIEAGLAYFFGGCVKENREKAIYWLEKAAEKNETFAIQLLETIKRG